MAGLIDSAANGLGPAQQPTTPATGNGYVAPDGTVKAPATQQATTTNATASNTTAVGYDPTKSQSSSYQAAQGTAANAGLTTNNVDDKQTVAGQLTGLISDNSPLLQQARSNAQQQANSRGLLNSSMAQTAADSAVYQTALPIAQQDATTNFNNATHNMDASNQNAQYNATNQQDMTKTNLGATNAASSQNSSQQQQTNLANQSAENTAASQNAQAQNAANSQNAQQQTDVSKANAAAANSNSQFNAQQSNAAALQAMDDSVKTFLDTQDNANKITLQAMDGQTKVTLANIQAQYQQALASSQAASDIYKTVVGNITTIMTNKDMDAGAKQAAVDQQTAMLQSGLKVAGAVANVDLSQLLNFTVNAGAANAGANAPAPAPVDSTPFTPYDERNGRGGGPGGGGGSGGGDGGAGSGGSGGSGGGD